MTSVEEVGLDDRELCALESQTWRQLKTDPNAAQKILIEVGWIRVGVRSVLVRAAECRAANGGQQ